MLIFFYFKYARAFSDINFHSASFSPNISSKIHSATSVYKQVSSYKTGGTTLLSNFYSTDFEEAGQKPSEDYKFITSWNDGFLIDCGAIDSFAKTS